jgi:hypothetical protein
MTAHLMPFLVRLAVDRAVRQRALELDDTAYERFRAACEFARIVLARSLLQLDGRPGYLVVHAGFLLSIKFDRLHEKFLVVAFDDQGDDPLPPKASRDQILYNIAGIVGFDVGPVAIVDADSGLGSGAFDFGAPDVPARVEAKVSPRLDATPVTCEIRGRFVAEAAVKDAKPNGALDRVVVFSFRYLSGEEPAPRSIPDSSSDP